MVNELLKVKPYKSLQETHPTDLRLLRPGYFWYEFTYFSSYVNYRSSFIRLESVGGIDFSRSQVGNKIGYCLY